MLANDRFIFEINFFYKYFWGWPSSIYPNDRVLIENLLPEKPAGKVITLITNFQIYAKDLLGENLAN